MRGWMHQEDWAHKSMDLSLGSLALSLEMLCVCSAEDWMELQLLGSMTSSDQPTNHLSISFVIVHEKITEN